MEKWVITAKKADFNQIARDFHIDPVTARLIRNRDIVGNAAIETYLQGDISALGDWRKLKDLEKAVEILAMKISFGKKIRIIGDYDIDGVMATQILMLGLEKAGAKVDYVLPDRIGDGYGINENLIKLAAGNQVDTIITCDNGIAAFDQIGLAKELGMTVIVTDHHEVVQEEHAKGMGDKIPPADAVINPKQKSCKYPFKGLCGAAVAGKLMEGLFDYMGMGKEAREKLLPFEAFATIGDVMDLVGENRILVKEGLKRLRESDNLGLLALMDLCGIRPVDLNPYHIGFILGPCINASGRLETARLSMQLLRSRTGQEARRLAERLFSLNEERKKLTEEGVLEAVEMVESSSLKEDKVLVLYLPDCHESLAGIIAGRLREAYHKPTFVLTRGREGIKGSGRSIEAYSMFAKMQEVREFFNKFGGHPMAAGLSMDEDKIMAFRKAINAKANLTEEDIREKVVIDVAMPISYITKELVEEFALLEPFGKGNPKPIFAQKDLDVVDYRLFGKGKKVAKVRLRDQTGRIVEGVLFRDVERFENLMKGGRMISIAYYPTINSWRDMDKLEVVISNFF